MSNLSSLVAVVLLANIVGQQGLPRLLSCLVAVAVDFDEVLLFEVSKLEVRTVGGGSLVFLPLIFPFFSAKNKLVRVALKML